MNCTRIPQMLLISAMLMAPFASTGFAQENEKDAKPAEPESASDIKPEDAKQAEPKLVKIPGVFEAVQSTELSVDNEHLTTLELSKIVPHGTTVKKGQPVVWFKTEDLDKQLDKAESDLKLAELAMQSEEFSYKQFLKTQELDKQAAKRARDEARNDYDHFVKTELERDIASAHQNLKSNEFSVESAEEELQQLQQMYDEDDLTEESEEIVLRRAKFTAESALFRLEDAKIRTQRSIDVLIPRTEISRKDSLDRAMMTYDRAMHDLDNARRKRDIEIANKRDELSEQRKKFTEMRAERAGVVIKAPHDGIVLHGELTRGVLPAKPVSWEPDAKVNAGQTIATLVTTGKLVIRVDLPEEHVALVTPGTQAKVVAKAFPDCKLSGKVRSVAAVPYAPGKYDCVVNVSGKHLDKIVPTMSCELQFTEPTDDQGTKE
ncbi:HlyD family efflux transporter periplasmic adaptor subunit [Stieleria varia]